MTHRAMIFYTSKAENDWMGYCVRMTGLVDLSEYTDIIVRHSINARLLYVATVESVEKARRGMK